MKTTINFLISIVLLGIYFGGGYYYFETHSVFKSFSQRDWFWYSVYYSLVMGGISILYVAASKKGWNSFLNIHSMLMNLCFTAGIIYSAVEYGTFYFRGKILFCSVGIMAVFVLQFLLFFIMRGKSKSAV